MIANTNVSLANYLLIRKESAPNDILTAYKQTVDFVYSARVEDVDFKNDGQNIQEKINKWAKNETNGLIDPMLSSPPHRETVALVLNTILFRGKWKHAFHHNDTETFYNNGISRRKVDFLIKYKQPCNYQELKIAGQEMQVLVLEYEDTPVTMTILLPKARDGLQAVLKSQELHRDLERLILSSHNITDQTELNLFLPKFKVEAEYTMNEELKGMGIRKILSDADLSGINGRRDLIVSQVIHKARIDVTEEGTGAAVTTHLNRMPFVTPVASVNFRADHPFLFYLKDTASGAVLFLGAVQKF